jgi:hypothetical protein
MLPCASIITEPEAPVSLATMIEGIVLVLCLVMKIALDHRAGVHLKELLRRRFGSAQQIPEVPGA